MGTQLKKHLIWTTKQILPPDQDSITIFDGMAQVKNWSSHRQQRVSERAFDTNLVIVELNTGLRMMNMQRYNEYESIFSNGCKAVLSSLKGFGAFNLTQFF